jgi:cyclic beta-1,2-glucan synthetase
MTRSQLSGRVEAGLDPCAVVQAPFEISPGESRTVVFLLGEAGGGEEARRLVNHYRDATHVEAAFKEMRGRWDQVLTTVEVTSPDRGLDFLLNRWLLYQVRSCRLWARSAFYQSGGAYGFRDQLQDVMALVYGAPDEVRAHIVRAAARQFREGDVQHWWHPPSGAGIRTRFSDDFLWLPFVAAHYISTTGDRALLDEIVPFLKAPLLQQGQEEDYGVPEIATETAALYEHCARAIDHGMRYGAHGLPLMGTGDWNDGMNRVGAQGKGESVWVGWFQLAIFKEFCGLARARNDFERAERWQAEQSRLRAAVEEHGWDGQWYLRAFFDDGTPLGSSNDEECRIDSIVQSWAVISGAAPPDRARQAIAAVEDDLVRQAEALILLFTPPFDKGKLQPGYVKGYVPGIRENGGQYTHAAAWVVQAMALLGRGGRAVELFRMLNPINHASQPDEVARYRVEPYVVAADVYSTSPHTGRGGWTWYTGSAGWLYRVALEAILGFQLRGNRLTIDPCIPGSWPGFAITYRHHSAVYRITVDNSAAVERGVRRVELDGLEVTPGAIVLTNTGEHTIKVVLG